MATNLGGTAARWRGTWRWAAAVAAGLAIWLHIGVGMNWPSSDRGHWFLLADPVVAVGCLAALAWRRRHPLAVTLAVAVASTASSLATGAGAWALCSIATRRRPAETGVVAVAYVVASHLAVGSYPVEPPPGAFWYLLTVPTATAVAAVAAGTAVGARRAEVRTLRERADGARRERHARIRQAQALERNRVAHEIHHALAPRIALIARQSATLDGRRLRAEDSRTLVRDIAEGCQRALEELRDVLAGLGAATEAEAAARLSLETVRDLAAGARGSGVTVTVVLAVTGTPSDVSQRTAYRIVQEGLRNAVEHAPGSSVRVTIDTEREGRLTVRVLNSPSPARPRRDAAPPPEPGLGLLRLAERVDLLGGRIHHGPTADDGYALTALLPCLETGRRNEHTSGQHAGTDTCRPRR
ncbi:sensor histidine kinase [Streptomyces phytohabitans]|uniref:sensor histidine kinase n=1 Tax=Streptomyces phytohabitans TaxID=1150371 RepID=UPI00345C3D62